MNSVLDYYGHNFILDELAYWPPKEKVVVEIEAIIPEEGKCVAIIHYHDGSTHEVEVERGHFENTWNEACAVLKSVTDVKNGLRALNSSEVALLEDDRQRCIGNKMSYLEEQAKRIKKEKIEEAIELFNGEKYELFLNQFGNNCINLSPSLLKRIEIAKQKINA